MKNSHPLLLKGKEKKNKEKGRIEENPPRIRRIIHIITNRIHPFTIRTTILPPRTPTRTHTFLRRIIHIIPRIPRRARIPLKSMQQPKPMPHLMHRRLSLIIPLHGHGAAGHRPGEDVAPICCVVGGRVFVVCTVGGGGGYCCGEGAVA